MKEKSLFKNMIYSIVYKLLNVVFPLASASYISNILLAEGVGKVAYAQNIASYFVVVAALGIPAYGVREIARIKKDKNMSNKLFSELFLINAFSTAFFCIIYFTMIYSYKLFETRLELYIIFGLLLLFNFINVDWFYQGKEEYGYIAARSFIIKILSLASMFLFVKDENDYLVYAIITCLATGGNYIFNIINLRKYVRFTLKNLDFTKHIKPIFILLASTIATELYSKVDITLLGIFAGDVETGYYSNAIKLINMVIILTTAITSVFLPRLSYYFESDRNRFNEMVNQGVKLILFIALPCFGGIILVSNWMVPILFGNSFLPIVVTIRILSCLILIKSLGDILVYQVIISTNKEKLFPIVYSITALLNILLNWFLIPRYFQDGAAIASVISELTGNIILFMVSRKAIKLKFSRRYLLSILSGMIGMVIVVLSINNLSNSVPVNFIASILMGSFVYFGLNLILKNEIMYLLVTKLKRKFNPII
ncbi:O-unit flippase [Bacillus sp. AFS006103]|nr:O-unit flippase [Bacillus sp. AFS006103]